MTEDQGPGDDTGQGDEAGVDDSGSSMMVSIVTPFVVFGATWAVRRVLNSIYAQVTGRQPPTARDPGVALRRALLWAAVTAAAGAVTEVVVYRASSRAEHRSARHTA
jgi:ABC-type Fe3+ transport system permease subunit